MSPATDPHPAGRGWFITLEGGEGAGKSTQARLLAQALARAGHAVLATREPGGTPEAELLRRILLAPDQRFTPAAETLLHFAAREQHVAQVIRPALAAGTIVLCDRFTDSTRVYQGAGLGVPAPRIEALAAWLGCPPDLTLILDLPVESALARLAARGGAGDRYERLGAPFFTRVREGFRRIAAADPGRCVLLDAAAPPEMVQRAIRDLLAARLGIAA